MPLTYGFYSSMQGDRKYDATDISHIFDGLLSEGVYPNFGDSFVISPGTGLKVLVGTGRAWLNSTWSLNDSEYELAIDAPHATYNRIDSVVIEINTNSDVRANSLKIVKGTPSGAPVEPTLDASPGIFQYRLANVLVAVGVSTFTPEDISQKVGSSETPYAGLAYPAKIEDLEKQVSEFSFITPKILKDFNDYFGFIHSDVLEKALISDEGKWKADSLDGWCKNSLEWVIDKNKTTTIGYTNMFVDPDQNTYLKSLFITLSSAVDVSYYGFPVIVESSAGIEQNQAFYIRPNTSDIKVNYLNLAHPLSGGSVTFVDICPRIKTVGDQTARFNVGDSIKLTQDGIIKYFKLFNLEVILESGITYTRLTLFKGIDHNNPQKNGLLSNSLISNVCNSHSAFPIGFPSERNNWGVRFFYWYPTRNRNIASQWEPMHNYIYTRYPPIVIFLPKGFWNIKASIPYTPTYDGATAGIRTKYGISKEFFPDLGIYPPSTPNQGTCSQDIIPESIFIVSSNGLNSSQHACANLDFNYEHVNDSLICMANMALFSTAGLNAEGFNIPLDSGRVTNIYIQPSFI